MANPADSGSDPVFQTREELVAPQRQRALGVWMAMLKGEKPKNRRRWKRYLRILDRFPAPAFTKTATS